MGSLTESSFLRLEGDRVTGEEPRLADRRQRVRNVRQGADGTVFVVTDERNGQLWTLTPCGEAD